MRQAGIIAAGALYALRHHRERLADDHRRARVLAEGLSGIPGISLEPQTVETNIVVAPLAPGAAPVERWCAEMAARSILVVPFGARALRLVAHLDICDEDVARTIEAFREVAPALAGSG